MSSPSTKNFLSEHSGTVLAASAIESSNVVGYMAADTQKDGITAGVCFVPVSGTTVDLTDIKVTGYTGETDAAVPEPTSGILLLVGCAHGPSGYPLCFASAPL